VRPARAATKVRFLTSWFAQAEHGGFYQAKATGLYEKAGLDVEIKMGGPQVNQLQLMAAGEADLIMGYDIQVLNAIEKGLNVTTVGSAFQFDLQGIMTHDDVKSLADLKGRKILVASSAYTTFWPWMKQHFGFTDEQTAPYTFNLQPFILDPTLAQQGYVTSEPFEAERNGAKVKFFLFADEGYPPYSGTIVATRAYVDANSDTVARFVKASMEGWKSYMENPAAGNVLIKQDNPKMTDAQISYSVAKLNAIKAVNGGDAATKGIGILTEARWKKTRDFLVEANLLKADTDWKQGFTDKYVKDLHITMA
jgi:NitT/TauT family transport system substrate-binding protein